MAHLHRDVWGEDTNPKLETDASTWIQHPACMLQGQGSAYTAYESPLAPAISTNPSSAAFPSIFSFFYTCLVQAQVGMQKVHFPSAGPAGSGCHILGGSQHPTAALHCSLLASSSGCQCVEGSGQQRMGVAKKKSRMPGLSVCTKWHTSPGCNWGYGCTLAPASFPARRGTAATILSCSISCWYFCQVAAEGRVVKQPSLCPMVGQIGKVGEILYEKKCPGDIPLQNLKDIPEETSAPGHCQNSCSCPTPSSKPL